jgi:uncharacterized protein
MSGIHQEFNRRASRIPFLGLGLSVDVYSPDIFELWEELKNRQISMSYLEIFHAAPEALEVVRARLPGIPLAYHAEGLWFTQPDWETAYDSPKRLQTVARDLRILRAYWVNQECATKEIAGFAFGTYLPPLFTGASAEVTAYHTWKAQRQLDQYEWAHQSESPLLLLEGPPLSYFSTGDISYAEFFTRVVAMAPCGLVLDLGHIWTVYRYSGAWRTQSLESFCAIFLEQFPLERVIQIHIAGLNCHPKIPNPVTSELHHDPPPWIDAHEAPIPEELLQLLARVVQEPCLINLKGIALEVDNKQVPLICQEVKTVIEILEPFVHSQARLSVSALEFQGEEGPQVQTFEPSRETLNMLTRQYMDYVELATGKVRGSCALPQEWNEGVDEGLNYYASQYLPHEIISWGGDVRVMFPQTCQLLDQYGVSLNRFVEFWFAHSRKSESEYDFFILKTHLFVDFLRQVLPQAVSTAKQEAELISQGYVIACQGSPA